MDNLFTHRRTTRLVLSAHGRYIARVIGILLGTIAGLLCLILLVDAVTRSPYQWWIVGFGVIGVWTAVRLEVAKRGRGK